MAVKTVAGTRLTARELRVLNMVACGMTNGQIARRLSLSEDTVKTHMTRLFGRLDACNRAHAVALGYEQGYLVVGTRDNDLEVPDVAN